MSAHETGRRALAVAFAVAVSAAGAGPAAAQAPARTLRVSAAASLTDAFRELAAAFERAHPGLTVELNFAGSQLLRTQIEQGAKMDVFASADLAHAEALAQAGLLGPHRVFARNRLVVAVPAGGGKVRRLEDLAQAGIRVVVAGPSVPAGRYTSEALGKLDAGPLGAGFRKRVEANVVSQETSVRAVLAKVALGEADAGFVYVTDLAGARNAVAIEIPKACNVIAEYPIGVLRQSAAAADAASFVEYVLSADGQAVLGKHGFTR
jgi:molybdate transport system substrate-binding protein